MDAHRDHGLSVRRALPAGDREAFEAAIIDALEARRTETMPARIAAYWPHRGEPDLRPWLQALWNHDVTVALPVLGGPGDMTFRVWRRDADLAPNRYGIPEPADGEHIGVDAFDWVLMPTVAFDHQGHRVGMGGGYYDRALSGVNGKDRPLRIGIAFSSQQVDNIAARHWDIPLHAVVTEKGWFTFER